MVSLPSLYVKCTEREIMLPLLFKIIASFFVGLSCLSALIKNINIFAEVEKNKGDFGVFASTIYGWAWRGFVIFVIWYL